MTGILLDKVSFQVRCRISLLSKPFGRPIAGVASFKKTAPLKLQHQLLEDGAHLRSDAESFRREIDSDFRAHLAETNAEQSRGQIILRGNRAFEAILSANSDHIGERSLRHFAQTRQRHWLQRRRLGSRRRPFPIQMIENVASRPEIVATDARHADRPEAINENARRAVLAIESDSSVHEFRIAFEHTGADPDGCSRRPKEKNAAEANR